MTKLLIAADTYYPKKDGVIVFLEKIIPALSKHLEVTIIAPRFESGEKPIGESKLITLETSKRLKLADYPSIKFSKQNRNKIKKAVKEADLIFAQDLALIGLLSIKYAKKYRKPVLTFTHQIPWEHLSNVLITTNWINRIIALIIKKLAIRAYNRCKLILVPYKDFADELTRNKVYAKKAAIKLGVDSDIFKPAEIKAEAKKKIGIDPNKTVIGYCGRLSKEKDLKTLKRAFTKLDIKEKLLLLIGDGPEKRVFEEMPDVRITGFVDNVVPFLQATDIFVMPSLTETTSLATLEAMSCGLPVIVTKVGYMKEYIKNKINGLFFPKRNDYILRKKIEMLANDQELREELGTDAREDVINKFSWKRTVENINKILTIFRY
jgi:glycosyltransferase involved in cell wall biosynthesis